jgi:hypothetical protein
MFCVPPWSDRSVPEVITAHYGLVRVHDRMSVRARWHVTFWSDLSRVSRSRSRPRSDQSYHVEWSRTAKANYDQQEILSQRNTAKLSSAASMIYLWQTPLKSADIRWCRLASSAWDTLNFNLIDGVSILNYHVIYPLIPLSETLYTVNHCQYNVSIMI